MHQTVTTSSTATLSRLAVSGPEVSKQAASMASRDADGRMPVLPYPMEEPDAGPDERRVPLLVSVSVLLVFSLAVWTGLIWMTAKLLS